MLGFDGKYPVDDPKANFDAVKHSIEKSIFLSFVNLSTTLCPRDYCSKADSAFHPSEVDEMSTRNFWELSGKK